MIDDDIINYVLTNIKRSLSYKIKYNEKNINKGNFILISEKLKKKGIPNILKKLKKK